MKISKKILLTIICSALSATLFAQKPKVWIISDGLDNRLKTAEGKNVTDPDDVSAIAAYLLMSNHFDTRGIVISSNGHAKELKKAGNQGKWAENFFGKAYKADLPNLNKEIGGYKDKIRFIESYLKEKEEKFSLQKQYTSIKNRPSIQALFDEVDKSEEVVNVMCWGVLTEAAIFVNYCKNSDRFDILNKVRFISHWTSSSLKVGTKEHPERVHNCFNDGQACDYLKKEAINGTIKLYECGSIGQTGLAEGYPAGREFYSQFMSSNLGKIYYEGKYVEGLKSVDGSDAATFWVLLGNWGVSLNDIADNGTNFIDVEKRNMEIFNKNAILMQNELLRRSRVVSGSVANPKVVENLFPQHGLTDGHVWVENGRVYLFGGHDTSWLTNDTWKMDRWEIWSSENLIDWTHHNNILPTETYIGDKPNCWAGDIVKRDGKYYWYFSNTHEDTGVAMASEITGKYVDQLGKPLIPKGFTKGRSYDPEVVEEDGKYYIIFSAGQYRIIELNDDMISFKGDPKILEVFDSEGKEVRTADKSSMFKRNGIFYLVWGNKYATSKNLFGPYKFQGPFLEGGHTSIFQWYDGQWYVVQENKDLSLFYRGLSLKPIHFNLDGLIQVPPTDFDYPGKSRIYNFEVNEMGWRDAGGTTLQHNKKGQQRSISGKISGNAAIESSMWLLNNTKDLSQLKVTLKNSAKASQARVYVAAYDVVKGKGPFWSDQTIDWSKEFSQTIDLEESPKTFVEYTISLKDKITKSQLKAIRIEPALGVKSGEWEIKTITIE